MYFEIIGEIERTETIAEGKAIRVAKRLRKLYGGRSWRKLKGIAQVRLGDGTIWTAEIHWYEAHGIGRRGMKLKRRWRE